MSSPITLETLRSDYAQANSIQTKTQLVAFHLKNYIITAAVEHLKAQRAQGKDVSELMKEVQNWFQDLEALKTTLGQQVQNKDQARKQFSDFSLYLFKKANDQFQSGNYSQQLAEEFSTVILLFEAYSIFDSPSQEIDSNSKDPFYSISIEIYAYIEKSSMEYFLQLSFSFYDITLIFP